MNTDGHGPIACFLCPFYRSNPTRAPRANGGEREWPAKPEADFTEEETKEMKDLGFRTLGSGMEFTFFWLELPRITSNYLELVRRERIAAMRGRFRLRVRSGSRAGCRQACWKLTVTTSHFFGSGCIARRWGLEITVTLTGTCRIGNRHKRADGPRRRGARFDKRCKGVSPTPGVGSRLRGWERP
jgi:hypothetical protein